MKALKGAKLTVIFDGKSYDPLDPEFLAKSMPELHKKATKDLILHGSCKIEIVEVKLTEVKS